MCSKLKPGYKQGDHVVNLLSKSGHSLGGGGVCLVITLTMSMSWANWEVRSLYVQGISKGPAPAIHHI